ncbi:LysR family transcriptional regulator [Niallia sp. JL1B1071]|uniref:LysR family transcriptional regulator n=1 Tax=Niallia tiangongensis TaxID=3237105 RepID=UPI0037DD9C0F
MDLEGLYSFLVVAKEKSISKASQSLHVTQPTLSTRIRKLEEGLGFSLVDRNWKGIQLTREGNYFLPYASRLFRDLSDVSTVLTYNEQHEPRVSFSEVTNVGCLIIGIDSWLAPSFSKQILNQIKINDGMKYKIITRPTSTLVELLDYNAIDLAVIYNEKLDITQESTPLMEDEMVLLFHNKHTIKNDFSNLSVLKDKPFLLFDNPILVYHSNFTSQVIKEFNIEHFQIIDDINVMINTIVADLAYTIVPKSSIHHFIELFNLGIIPIGFILMGRKVSNINIQIVYHAKKLSDLGFEDFANSLFNSIVQDYKLI